MAERRQLASTSAPTAPAMQGCGAAVPSTARAARGAYVSPLLCFRSYRRSMLSVALLQHRINPNLASIQANACLCCNRASS